MSLMTPDDFRSSLRELNPDVWVRGQRVASVADEPLFQPGVNAIALTYELALKPELANTMLAPSLDGHLVNRFLALDRSADDLIRKLEMCRLLCQRTGCAQRYLMHDALGALFESTAITDAEHGSKYSERFATYLRYVQERDITCAVAMTDPKGDRSQRPHQQADPDHYLRIVDRTSAGLVVRGAKANVTGAPYTHEVIVLPTRSMVEADADYAVAFAIRLDAPGLRVISRPSGRPEDPDAPFSSRYGQSTALLVFRDVLVPWERVFLAGEWGQAGKLTEAFANHHRHSCIGCRAGLGDMIIGAAAELADFNGLPVDQVSNIRSALAELIKIVEAFYACGVAASLYGHPSAAGNFVPDPVYSNVGKLLMSQQIYDIFRLAHEIAGGIVVTAPTHRDVESTDNSELIAKYMTGRSGTAAADRLLMASFLHDISASDEGGWYAVISAHGGGSPEAMRISSVRSYDVAGRRDLARALAHGVDPDGCIGCGGCGTHTEQPQPYSSIPDSQKEHENAAG